MGQRFAWGGIDGGYGKEPAFLRALDAQGEVFVADIHKDQRVYLAEAWQSLPLRDSTKGVIEVEVLHARVWLWNGQEAAACCWHLVVRRDRATRREYKYALSNAPAGTSWQVLAQRQGQCYWVERTFEDAKGEVGLTLTTRCAAGNITLPWG